MVRKKAKKRKGVVKGVPFKEAISYNEGLGHSSCFIMGLQQRLNIPETGCIDEEFIKAVSVYQKSKGLCGNGLLDEVSLELLMGEVVSTDVLVLSVLSEDEKQEALLHNRNILCDESRAEAFRASYCIDDDLSEEEIVRHVCRYQIRNGLEPDGKVCVFDESDNFEEGVRDVYAVFNELIESHGDKISLEDMLAVSVEDGGGLDKNEPLKSLGEVRLVDELELLEEKVEDLEEKVEDEEILNEEYITAHFRWSEFASEGDGLAVPKQYRENVRLVCEQLEILRTMLGNRPITIQSGWRSEWWNKRVGGMGDDLHLVGKAVDFVVEGVKASTVRSVLESLIEHGKIIDGGVGRYPGFTSYDIGESRRWNG